jgi:hypothetical protein
MGARSVRLLALLSAAALTGAASGATDTPSDLQSRFDHETNSVHKAKLFEKLGDAQFGETRRASRASDFGTVGQIMEKYRDNARAAMDALKREHPNAERQMGGYKQLQRHIHSGLRELDETLIVAPPEYQPPLRLVRQDLASMDEELLQMLFPLRPEKKNMPKSARAPTEKRP